MPNHRQPGAQTLSDLEDAVNLLRAAPIATLLLHWIGSAPFALTVMLFWNDITQYRPSSAATVTDSLALAVLLSWMNFWRAAYAGRLRAQLSGAPYAPIAVFRVAAYQSLLGASKLVVLPFSILIVFPLASIVAFYRYASVLSCRADLSFKQIIAQASKLAAIDGRQTWAALPAVAFLQVLVTLNIATALMALPQLVRMLTGYESIFARAGMSLASNPLFAMASLAVGWLAIDPFIQAVYCVMYFRRESLASGEDLRAALRGLRRAALAAAALLCVFAGSTRLLAADAVTPEPLQKSIQQTMQAHEYDWRLPQQTAAQREPPWLVNMVEQIFRGIGWMLKQIGEALGKLIRWLFESSTSSAPSGAAPARALSVGIYALIVVILLLAALLVVRLLRTRRARPRGAAASVPVLVRLEDDSITPDQLPEDQWVEMAENCLREQNYRLALRAFYLANLAWLGRHEWIAINPGKTNREYEADLRRRARAFPEARAQFAENLSAFERSWYGLHPVAPEAVASFRERNLRIKSILAQPETVAA